MSKFILDTLFPISCLGCGTEGKYVCAVCESKLTLNPEQICIICKRPSLAGLTHPKCQSPYTADQLICAYDYNDEVISGLIIRGKYYFIPNIFKLLGEIMAPRLKADYPALFNSEHTILTHVPLHKWRQRWRGFNQAEVLCQSLAKHLNLKSRNLLKRQKFTRTQKDLEKNERQKNTANAFCLFPETDVKNQTVLLVDDVATTGSTLLEAAKVLKRNGATKVVCLAIARD